MIFESLIMAVTVACCFALPSSSRDISSEKHGNEENSNIDGFDRYEDLDDLTKNRVDADLRIADATPYGYTEQLTRSQIPNALREQVFDTTWSFQSLVSVADTAGGEPRNISEDSTSAIVVAKQELGYEEDQNAGCGKIALFSEIEYFADFFGFDWLKLDEYSNIDKVTLAKHILSTTFSIPMPNNQVFVPPDEMERSFDATMAQFGYNYVLKASSMWNLHLRINDTIVAFMNSIQKGFPIMWWCCLDNELAHGHSMIIYAYEIWSSTDAYGVTHEYPVFMIRYNWEGYTRDYFIYPEMLSYFSGAIFIDYYRPVALVKSTDVTSIGQYFFYEQTSIISKSIGDISVKRLRTGYIENEQLVMSARRNNAGLAYLDYTFPINVKDIYLYISLWSGSEYFDYVNDSFLLQRMSSNGEWITEVTIPIYLLTTHRDNPDFYHYSLSEAACRFRFVVTTSAIGNRNKGRICIGDMLVVGDTII